MWRFCKDTIADEFLTQDAQARCIIYNNIHGDDLKRLVGLKYAKDIRDKLKSIFGDGTRNNKEFKKKRNKNNNNKKRAFKNNNLNHKSPIPLVHMIQLMMRRDQKILNPKV